MEGRLDALARQVASLGKGMVQVNLRLTKLAQQLQDAPTSGGTEDGTFELLFDLLEAVDRTLSARSRPVRRWWWRREPPPPDLAGLEVARADIVAQLQSRGLAAIPSDGAVDPALHRVLETRPTHDPSLDGTVAAVHRAGWWRPGPSPTVLRHAHVTAWSVRGSP